MAEVITTLHPENDETIDLYPNIKKENIPANAIDASKIANEAITENKLDPALQAKLNDEVCILTLSGTSGLLSESNYNKLINAEIAFIVIDGKYYARSHTTQSGSPAYNIYWFVNITYDDSIVQRQIAVNSSNRFWVLSSQSKLLTFYRDDLDKIIVEAVEVDDLNVTNNIDCLGNLDVEDVNASGLYSLGYHDGEEEIGMATANLFEDIESIKFVEGNTYAVNDVVFYNRKLYVCIQAYTGTGIVPDQTQDTAYWARVFV